RSVVFPLSLHDALPIWRAVRAPHRGRRGAWDVRGDALARVRPGGDTAHSPWHVRAFGGLLRRVLPESAAGPCADQARLHGGGRRSEEHTSELQSLAYIV